jgi:Holliday junction resolvase RusA-like endonuclease
VNENNWTLFVPGVALPQGSKTAFISKSTGRPIVKDNNIKLPRWRMTVTAAAIERMQVGDREFPFTTPLAVSITFIFDRPKSHYGTGRNAYAIKKNAPAYPAVTPDLDKLLRAILDALTDAGVWHDDAQVCWVQTAKRYRDRTPLRGPGVHISVTEAM